MPQSAINARASEERRDPARQETRDRKEIGMTDRRILLSTLWIFATLNYLYADVFSSFFDVDAQEEALRVTKGSGAAVLAFAVLLETAIAMVLLSRILKYRLNRWTNVGAGLIHTVLVAWSLTGSTPELFYAFFAVVEIACTLFIVWFAWKWREPAGQPSQDARPS
jgi:threonine/homoserine/homoserine lactone efflux protein